jgi:hypothetical protein
MALSGGGANDAAGAAGVVGAAGAAVSDGAAPIIALAAMINADRRQYRLMQSPRFTLLQQSEIELLSHVMKAGRLQFGRRPDRAGN